MKGRAALLALVAAGLRATTLAAPPLADLAFEGAVEAHALRRLGDDRAELVALVRQGEEWRLLAAAAGDVVPRWLAVLPAASEAAPTVPQLATLDLDGDGVAEVLVATADGTFAVAADGLRPIAGEAYALAESIELPLAAGDRLGLVSVGRLTLLRGDAGRLAIEATWPLPVEVERRSAALVLSTSALRRLDRPGSPLLIGGPRPAGGGRLRVDFYDPTTGEAGASERWIRLPGPEAMEGSSLGWLEGEPVILVTTLPTDRIGVFAEQTLRLYRPAADRRRLGALPILTVPTEAKRWQRADPHLLDVSGDGKEDLVILHPKGLAGDELLVDTYLRELRRFAPRPRRMSLDVATEHWRYGDDLDGDGRPDLLAESGDVLLLFPGIAPTRGRPLAERPSVRLELFPSPLQPVPAAAASGDGEAEPGGAARSSRWSVVELDGVPPRELLIVSTTADGCRLRLLRASG